MNKHTGFLPTAFLLAASLLLLPLTGCSSKTNKAVAHDIKTTAGNAASATGEAIEDSSITTAVKTKILMTKGLDSLDISVETQRGVVYLTGMVNKPAQILLAGKTAAEVNGVQRVVNNLHTY